MNHLIERGDPRVADLFRRMGRVDRMLDELEGPSRRTIGGHRFVTDSELSKMLRVSRRTLLEYRSLGAIPYYLICGKILYSEAEIQRYLEKCRKRNIDDMELL